MLCRSAAIKIIRILKLRTKFIMHQLMNRSASPQKGTAPNSIAVRWFVKKEYINNHIHNHKILKVHIITGYNIYIMKIKYQDFILSNLFTT